MVMYLRYIVVFFMLCFFTSSFSSTLISKETSEENETRNQIRESLVKYLKYFASFNASGEERAGLIRRGLLGTPSYFGFNLSSKPANVDVSFDCKIKQLAFEVAQKLVTSKTLLKFIFDGLELGSLCNQVFQSSPETHHYHSKKQQDINLDQNSKVFFVDGSIKHGGTNDSEDERYGNIGSPLRSVHDGITECMKTHETRNCFILLRKGIHVIDKELLIQRNNIIIKSYDDENAVITSDKVINVDWDLHKKDILSYEGMNPIFEGIQPKQSTKSVSFVGVFSSSILCQEYCKDTSTCTSFAYFDNTCGAFSNMCYARNDGKWNPLKHSGVISGKKVVIYKSDLRKYDLKKVDQVFVNGRRAVRARFPNANPETMGLHTVPSGYVENAEKWLPPIKHAPATEIQINEPTRPASRFPGFAIGIGGSVSQFDPPESFWGTQNPYHGSVNYTYVVPSGLQYSEELEINSRSWKNPSAGILHTFQSGHWGNWMFKLDSRNETNRSLYWTYGGFQEARGSTTGREWYVENIFEELDVAEEWFYDEETKIIYYSPNGTLPSQITIPQLPSLFRVIGSQDNPVENFTLSDTILQHSTQTFMEKYMVPSGGDWSVHRNGAVYLEGTVKATIKRCTFDSPGGNGIFVSNFNRETLIADNVMYRNGDNGIVLVGDAHLMDGSGGNQPRGVQVLRNVIFDNGVWGKQAYPFTQSVACQSVVRGNIMFNGPRAGINVNDGFGGGNQIEKNLLFNFVRETDDHGPINTWDRVPYITDLYDGKPSLSVQENQIYRNFLINNYRSVWPIDHDDGSCFWNDTYNYMVYGGFKNYLGHDKHSMYNVYVYPDLHPGKGASLTSKYCLDTGGQVLDSSGYGDVFAYNRCIMKDGNIYQLGSCSIQNINELIPFLVSNQYFTKGGKMAANCGSVKFQTLEQLQKYGLEWGSTIEELVADDEVISWGRELFGLIDN